MMMRYNSEVVMVLQRLGGNQIQNRGVLTESSGSTALSGLTTFNKAGQQPSHLLSEVVMNSCGGRGPLSLVLVRLQCEQGERIW